MKDCEKLFGRKMISFQFQYLMMAQIDRSLTICANP